MNHATSHEIAILVEAHLRRSQIRQLTDALMIALGIPEGHALVNHLTSSPCRTNREALVLWVQAQCLDHSIPLRRNTLRSLVNMLQYKFEAIQCDAQ